VTREEMFAMLEARLTPGEFEDVLTHLVHPAMRTAYDTTTRTFTSLVETEIALRGVVQGGDFDTGFVAGLRRAIELYPAPTL